MVVGARGFSERQQMVSHTLAVIDTIHRLARAQAEAQSYAKSYVLTGSRSYIEDTQRHIAAAKQHFANFAANAQDNPSQMERIGQLRNRLDEVLSNIETMLRARASGDQHQAISLIEQINPIADELFLLTRNAEEEEQRLLNERIGMRREMEGKLMIAFVVALLLNFMFIVWGAGLYRQYIEMRDESERSMQQANRELEQRVQERTSKLSNAVAELQRSNADLERFAYSASHDLQEPIRIVGSYVSLLANRYQGKLDANAEQYIRYAVSGAQRMQDLINDLLNFSMINRETLKVAEVNLSIPARSAIDYLANVMEECNAAVELEELPTAIADPRQMERVFRGLFSNAMKFRHPDRAPHIRIEATTNQDGHVICVSDNGIGFEQRFADNIFDLFSRLHPRGRYPGTGIGLATARRIVELHGGKIWARSNLNEGSKFFFFLPINGPPPNDSDELRQNYDGDGSLHSIA